MKRKNTPLFYLVVSTLLLLSFSAIPEKISKKEITSSSKELVLPTAPFVLRINSGGSTIVQEGITFQQDAFFRGNGKSYSNSNVTEIANTQMDDLYFSERSARSNQGSFGYAIPVANGSYTLNLHFAEIYWGATGGGPGGAGRRVFSAQLEGQDIITNYDINQEVGSMTAVVQSFTVEITDGELNLDFSASVDQPKVSALELFGEEEEPIDPALFRINSGGGDVVSGGITFQQDTFFSGQGKSYSNNNITDIANTDMDILYTSERSALSNQGSFGYDIPVPNGTHTLKLHFAEIYWGATGGGPGGSGRRVFSVEIEGQDVLVDYDINAEVGPMAAVIKTYDIEVTDNELNLNFIASTDQPKLSALELFGETVISDNVVGRFNCGGGEVIFNDRAFEADNYFGGQGKTYTNPNVSQINNTEFDQIYFSERSAKSSQGSFLYFIPITNGTYTLNLHFAEIYWGATGGGPGGSGRRVFDIFVEGQQVLTAFDINQEVGAMTALIKTFDITVSDEELNLVFSASIDQPKLSAIEIFGDGQIGIVDPNGCVWNDLPNSSLEKVESQSAKVNDKLYVFSGYDADVDILSATEIFDPAVNTWSMGAPMPIPKNHCGTAAIDNEVWLVGGFVGDHPGPVTTDVQIYNTVTNSWTLGPDLPLQRGSCTAVFNGRKLHVFGGVMADRRTDIAEHLVLDLDNQGLGWQQLAPLPSPRNHLTAANVDGLLYAIGGQFGHDNNPVNQTLVHTYDPSSDVWSQVAGMPEPRSHFESSTMVHNGNIIVAGGVGLNDSHYDNILKYDPATDLWAEICKLPEKLLAPTAKIFDDRLILTNGGANGNCCPNNKTRWVAVEPELPLSVNQISSLNDISTEPLLRLFPNPFSEKVILELEEKENVVEVMIYDTMGRQLETIDFRNKKSLSVDLNQPPGIYLLKILTSSGKKTTVRVVKK